MARLWPGRLTSSRMVEEEKRMQKTPDNAEETFKCNQCGHMFGTEGRKEAACPQCGFLCRAESCPVTGASNEGF
jgi:rubrerythrin